MVLADGTVVTCSRTENADLFRHAMGGYGLFGVITELELDMVPNALLTPRFEEMSGLEIGARFAQQLASDATIQMAYGRMDVALDRFFERALLITLPAHRRPERHSRGIRIRIHQPRLALSLSLAGGVRPSQALSLVDRGGARSAGRRQRHAQQPDERAGRSRSTTAIRFAPTSCTNTSWRRRASPSS